MRKKEFALRRLPESAGVDPNIRDPDVRVFAARPLAGADAHHSASHSTAVAGDVEFEIVYCLGLVPVIMSVKLLPAEAAVGVIEDISGSVQLP